VAEKGADELTADYRDRLVRFVRLRLDRRLKKRIDASDIVQEAFAEAVRRMPEYECDPAVPFFVWLRFITAQRLALTHRQHLAVHQRDVRRELPSLPTGDASVDLLAEHLAASQTSPSNAAVQAELSERLRAALAALPPADREVLALRHFEQLSNLETAAVLGVSVVAASHRYARALLRMKSVLIELFGSPEGSAL